MKPVVRTATLALLLLIANLSMAYAASWPVKEAIDLSSGFGDFRSGRFHAGVDLRTGGVTGKRVFAPVDGYLYKIRMSYYGYGKGLYFMGDDGHLYVFGHLSGFTAPIERIVKSRQMSQRRYYIDIDFPADSAKFKQGELMAFSGQTGAGAPHLHFEKRTADNLPLNPLTHGFVIKDKVRPFFTRIGFEQTDDHSLFMNGQRRDFYTVTRKGTGRYELEPVMYFNAPFGVLADCFDRMREGGMRQAVYKLGLYIDDQMSFEARMDTIDYGTTKSADLIYDFREAAEGEPRVRRLYSRSGNSYAGTQTYGDHLGLVGGGGSLAIGMHVGRIVAEDAFGNSSELRFRFYWGPPGNLYGLDSVARVGDTSSVYFFTPHPEIKSLNIEEVVIQLNRGDNWGVPPGILTTRLPDGGVQATITGQRLDRLTLRVVAVTADSCAIYHWPFSGIVEDNLKPAAVSHELTDDGLIVVAKLTAPLSYPAQVELYFRDSLLGIEKPSVFFTMTQYRCFVPARPEYRQIDRISVRLGPVTARQDNTEDLLTIIQVGNDSVQFSLDSWFSIAAAADDFYGPRFIELKLNEIVTRSSLKLNSDHYEILPEDVLLQGKLTLTLETEPHTKLLQYTALYHLNKEDNRWEWIGGRSGEPFRFAGNAGKGGSFALVFDDVPPAISDLSVFNGQTIRTLQPTITFKVKDDLSGIADDRSFNISIDHKWQIPEFDPERGICTITPTVPLQKGTHSLHIEVTDRVGNRALEMLSFDVVPAPRKKGT